MLFLQSSQPEHIPVSGWSYYLQVTEMIGRFQKGSVFIMHKFLTNFIHCGVLGWCMEILFTAADKIRRRQFSLQGNTSVWMFPIYGSAALFAPLFRIMKKKPLLFRGLTYMSMIFSVEYISGRLLNRKSLCPWDYGRSKWNIGKVVRLDYAPYWFGAGLLFEKVLTESEEG